MPDKVMEVAVDIKRQIQSLFNEAEVYRSQGLFVEAKQKYSRLAAFIFLAPLFGVLLGGIFQGDPLTLQLWIGLACVGGGIYLVNKPQNT